MDTGSIALAQLPTEPFQADVASIQVGYDANLSVDATTFAQSLDKVGNSQPTETGSAVTEALLAPLDFINEEAKSLAEYATSAIETGGELTPGEIVTLTTRSQEFMFYAQLTSNIANRTADGLQQLFRQQS